MNSIQMINVSFETQQQKNYLIHKEVLVLGLEQTIINLEKRCPIIGTCIRNLLPKVPNNGFVSITGHFWNVYKTSH